MVFFQQEERPSVKVLAVLWGDVHRISEPRRVAFQNGTVKLPLLGRVDKIALDNHISSVEYRK
jgi:hypothetical protein